MMKTLVNIIKSLCSSIPIYFIYIYIARIGIFGRYEFHKGIKSMLYCSTINYVGVNQFSPKYSPISAILIFLRFCKICRVCDLDIISLVEVTLPNFIFAEKQRKQICLYIDKILSKSVNVLHKKKWYAFGKNFIKEFVLHHNI